MSNVGSSSLAPDPEASSLPDVSFNLDHLLPKSKQRSGILTSMARRSFYRVLSNIEHGGLTIECGDETTSFGDSAAQTQGRMQVRDQSLFLDILTEGELGLGQSYVERKWESESPYHVVLILCLNEHLFRRTIRRFSALVPAGRRLKRLMSTLNDRREQRKNVGLAYDVGNDFFEWMLDPSLTFTCAIWPHAEATLEEAQQHKQKLSLAKLRVEPEHSVLEAGCGWGHFAHFIHQQTGARVTGFALSREQIGYASEHYPDCQFEYADYRDMTGSYDRIISIGMVDHVGNENIEDCVGHLAGLLKPGGRMLIHGMMYNDGIFHLDGANRRYPTFSQVLMPGASAITHGGLVAAAMHNGLRVVHSETFGIHYARTCRAWLDNLHRHREAILERYSERLYRAYCYAWAIGSASMETGTTLVQMVFEKKPHGSSLRDSIL